MSARAAILERLRAAAPGTAATAPLALGEAIDRHYDVRRTATNADPLAPVRRLLLDPARPEAAALISALPPTIDAVPFAQPIEAWKRELFDTIDAGFTVARSGIAATGTLVIAPDAGTPRTVSLVPPLHIAVVHAHMLHADLHEAVRAEQWRTGMPSNLVLVSGPSKTSDIQQTTAYGAHGPRRLWVVIVTDAQGTTS